MSLSIGDSDVHAPTNYLGRRQYGPVSGPPATLQRMLDPEEMSPEWLLARATEREHVIVAVALGQARWRELGEVIARSSDADEAQRSIATEFGLDDVQARAILDTQFRRISGADRARINQDLEELRQHISQLKDHIAADPESAGLAPTTPLPGEESGWWGYEPRD